jgi:hypothetical protein
MFCISLNAIGGASITPASSMWRMLPDFADGLRHFNPFWLHWCVSFANWLILENALMALDNAARCGQMLTVGS